MKDCSVQLFGRAQGLINWNKSTLQHFPNPDVLIQREGGEKNCKKKKKKKSHVLTKEAAVTSGENCMHTFFASHAWQGCQHNRLEIFLKIIINVNHLRLSDFFFLAFFFPLLDIDSNFRADVSRAFCLVKSVQKCNTNIFMSF